MTNLLTPSTIPSDADKAYAWGRYGARRPVRVPVVLGTNPRVVLNDPAWNPEGWTFEQAHHDPQTHARVLLRHALYKRQYLARFCDDPAELPEVWHISQMVYNVYEAAQFGARIVFPAGQVPVTEPLGPGAYEQVDACRIDQPISHGWLAERLAFDAQLARVCEGMSFEGRPVRVTPWNPQGSDGPFTVACSLVGDPFLLDAAGDPEKATRIMTRITDAAIQRMRAFRKRLGVERVADVGMADDSITLIGTEMYRTLVMPLHRRWYEAASEGLPDAERSMHLCGDATRHFPTIARELGVGQFDTGFPVDHGKLREQLGPDVAILGGPPVALLLSGTAEAVYQRTGDILTSGVMAGGRFILREGNNLPPQVPEENLAAMYAAALEHGWYTA